MNWETINLWFEGLSADPNQYPFLNGIFATLIGHILWLAGWAGIVVGVGRTAIDIIYLSNPNLFDKIDQAKQSMKGGVGGNVGGVQGGVGVSGNVGGAIAGFGSRFGSSFTQNGVGATLLALVPINLKEFTSMAADPNVNGGAAGAGIQTAGGVAASNGYHITLSNWLVKYFVPDLIFALVGVLLASGLAASTLKQVIAAFVYVSQEQTAVTKLGAKAQDFVGSRESSLDDTSVDGKILKDAVNEVYAVINTSYPIDKSETQKVYTVVEKKVTDAITDFGTIDYRKGKTYTKGVETITVSGTITRPTSDETVKNSVETYNKAREGADSAIKWSRKYYFDFTEEVQTDVITNKNAIQDFTGKSEKKLIVIIQVTYSASRKLVD